MRHREASGEGRSGDTAALSRLRSLVTGQLQEPTLLPRFLSPPLLPVSKRWGPFTLMMDTRTTLPPTLTVSLWSRPSLPPTLASPVCSLQNSQINASKTHQAIPSQPLECKGLPSVLFNLPPRAHPCSGPLTRASSVPPDSAGYDCLGPLHLPWPPPADHFPPPYPLILFRSQLGCHLRQAFPNRPLPPPLTTPLPSLVFLSTFYWFIYIFEFKTFP